MNESERNRAIMANVRKAQNDAVLTHLTDAAHVISPCPDDGRLHPEDGDTASAFRAAHGRWPLWWEMAVASRASEVRSTAMNVRPGTIEPMDREWWHALESVAKGRAVLGVGELTSRGYVQFDRESGYWHATREGLIALGEWLAGEIQP